MLKVMQFFQREFLLEVGSLRHDDQTAKRTLHFLKDFT